MQDILYPLRFEPIYQYRLWGGRRLADLFAYKLPDGPIGEAWILSDREDFPSQVADGPLQGETIKQLIHQWPEEMLGSFQDCHRFPLLLKFLDAREMLSVQVHPTDRQKDLLPPGESGKTEAWIVLEAGPESLIYAGLKIGTTPEDLKHLNQDNTPNHLAGFHPKTGDGVFIEAGTVHALGDGIVVFEVQQNSDVTFRLYDWDRIDAKTGKARELQVEAALACTDFSKGPLGPIKPIVQSRVPVLRELLIDCEHFRLWRNRGEAPFSVGKESKLTGLVCLEGHGQLEKGSAYYAVRAGDAFLLPAVCGACTFRPEGGANLLVIALP